MAGGIGSQPQTVFLYCNTMKARIGFLQVFLLCAHAQYEHVVDDDFVASAPNEGDDDNTGNEQTPQYLHFEDDDTPDNNVFLREGPLAITQDYRERTESTLPTQPLQDTIFNFGSNWNRDDDKLPSVQNSQSVSPKGYYHRSINKWAGFHGYIMYKTKSKKMNTKSMKQKSNSGRMRWKPSNRKTPYYWWAKGGGMAYGKGKGKQKWKGKGNKFSNGKGRKFKPPVPTLLPTIAPTDYPTITTQPTITTTPTNIPSSIPTFSVLLHVSVTGEDRTIQVQGNGGAEGASNPRLKVDRVGSEQDQVVIKFTDLNDNIPTGATIVAAYLSIETTTVTQRTVNWHRLLVPWEESTVNGRYFGSGIPPINPEILVQPNDSEALSIPSITFVGSDDVVIDLTEDVQYWIDNPGTNHGWVIIADPSDPEGLNEWGFWGLDSTNNAPMLVISYTL